jgi:transposase
MEILQTKRLDHLGLVMGTLRELGIIDLINQRIGANTEYNVSTGEVVAAMVMNGLGFVSRPLSLTPQFFESKALDLLFDREIEAEDLNRHQLGRALDDIHKYGCELLFSEIARHVCQKGCVAEKFISLDTTSFSVSGEYDVDTDENEIILTHGYSKDHRPDLKQAVLELVTSQDGGIPLLVQCCDGNASDNKIFKDRCEKLLSSFKNSESPRYLVGDSKLYHKANAVNLSEIKFITRIPRTYKEENNAIDQAIAANVWHVLNKENRYYECGINHLGMEQRWFVVHSKSAESRTKATVERQMSKEYKAIECALKHLRNKEFSCENDALDALNQVSARFHYHQIVLDKMITRDYFADTGRPKKESQPIKTVYQISAATASLLRARKERLVQHSCYVIGTNTTDSELTATDIIEAYKNQNASVERGFRFLKDPQFFVSSFFLKKPSRIMSLLMIMTLSLLIYSVTQRHLRNQLKQQNDTLPNQIDKPVKNPTMRWIFQLLEGIDVVYVSIRNKIHRKITGLTTLRKKIIQFFFLPVLEIYQIGKTG